MKDRESWLLGLFVGDGSLSKGLNSDYKISFYLESVRFAQVVCKDISEIYGAKPRIYIYKKKKCYEVYFRNKNVWRNFLEIKNNLTKLKNKIKFPINFIAGIIDAEGHIDLKGYRITITLKSSEISKLVLYFLRKIGIIPKVYKTSDESYRIRIYGKKNMLKFLPYLKNPEKIEKLLLMVPRQQTGPTVRGESQGSEPD